jgi:hypothetical protein
MSDASPVRAGDTLILGNGAQLHLINPDEVGLPASAYASEEQRGRFTGERLFSTNPKLYNAIVALIGRGLGYREIGEVCSVSTNTVCGVAWRERIPVETIRERIGRIGLDVAQLSLEAIRDILADPEARKKIPAKDLAIIHGISTTNAQLMLGGATSRHEELPICRPSHDDYFHYLDRLKNVTPATGSAAAAARARTPTKRVTITYPAL